MAADESGRSLRVRLHSKGRAKDTLQPLRQQLNHVGAAKDRRRRAQHRVNAGSHHVQANRHRLLRVPFRRGSGQRQGVNVHPQRVGQRRRQRQDARVVHATAHVQRRRDAQRLAHLAQPRPGQLGRFGNHQPRLAIGHSGAAGHEYQNVIFNQPLRQFRVAQVLLDLGVAAANDAHRAANFTGHNGVNQRLRRAAQRAQNGFHRKTGHDRRRLYRDRHPLRDAVGIILNRRAHDLLADFQAVFGVKADVLRAREFGFVEGADHFSMEAFGCFGDGRHDALIIHNHHLDCAGHDAQFLH